MAIEVKTKRRDLMKLKIECGILLQNSKVQQRIEEQRKDFQKKKERVQLIRIAKLYKEYIEFEQNEKSQMQEIINVKNRIEQLKMEVNLKNIIHYFMYSASKYLIFRLGRSINS